MPAIQQQPNMDVETVLAGKYPAKAHVKNVVEYMKKKDASMAKGGILYLEAQKTRMNEDNDEAAPFRQRRYFYYLTGCELPDSYYTYDVATDKSTLYIPPIEPDDVIWSGLPLSPQEALEKYDIDTVTTADKLPSHLSQANLPIWAIGNQISPETASLTLPSQDLTLLKEAIEECRVIKDDYEVALTRKANMVSTIAHTAVLKATKQAKNERELEAIFLERCVANGCREQAYHGIVASGRAAATLHYVKNDQPLEGKLNLLLDASGQYDCYASDITRTFPISGEFSPESRAIYDIVLTMQKKCIEALKEGVVWDDVHILAHKIAIDGLLKLGILKGDAKEILEKRTSVAFFPHGLGHYLGMDTHDTGGHANYADKDSMFRYLRVRGKLRAGSIITVEPGIYFCNFIIEPYLQDEQHARFIDEKVLEKYWDVGGVRIEDDILITKDGYINLTDTPKEVDEVLSLINGGGN